MTDWNRAGQAFPNFPLADLPPMPPTFCDTSFRNDACPSIASEALGLHIFIDYENPQKRETEFDLPRFSVRDTTQHWAPVLETDVWLSVLALIDRRRFEAWQSARVWCADLPAAGVRHAADWTEEDEIPKGYVYPDGAFILDSGDDQYWTIADRGDVNGTLARCEEFLWEHHSTLEYR